MAQLEAELNVDAALLAHCPNPAIASRYRALFQADGLCLCLRPLILTPDDLPLVVDADVARADPALAVFSAICHGDLTEVETAFPALVAVLREADLDTATLYYDVVLAGLPAATRPRWEAFVTTAAGYEFQSELLRGVAARGEARGKASGEAEAILTVLKGRGLEVPDDVRDRVLECTDTDQLNIWLLRAITATTADDVTRE